jgi:hypothetical protein
MKEFENQFFEAAVRNSEEWFGEEMTLPVVKHTFFPCLKYSKDKMTKKVDPTKPPSIRVKVPNYGGRWAIEIYDPSQTQLFPCENANMTPMDFIPKKSMVACVIQCGGLWFGGKGWGLTWKLVQAVVKPQEVVSVFGRCHIQLSMDDISKMDTPVQAGGATEGDDEDDPVSSPSVAVTSTEVEDSDAEEETVQAPVQTAPTTKKIVKKASEPVVQEAAEAEVEAEVAAAPKKKIVKKKAMV